MHRILFRSLGVAPHEAHVHLTRLRGATRTKVHDHDFHEAFLVLEGRGTHYLNGQALPMAPGDLVAIRPEDRHWFETEAEGSLLFSNMAVSAPWHAACLTVLGREDAAVSRSRALEDRATRELAALMERAGRHEATAPLAATAAWQAVLGHLDPARLREPEATPPAWLLEWREGVRRHPEHLVEPIAFWQARAGRSPEHLARSCRRYFRQSPSEVINEARVEHAKRLLGTTDAKVITVALEAGFNNMAHFHRLFAKATGATPRRWRRSRGQTVP
jgi:AraC family cel operon transcriptional repressor